MTARPAQRPSTFEAPGHVNRPLAFELPPEAVEAIAARVAVLLDDRTPAAPEWLTVPEAAEYLRCRPKRVYDLCSQRRVPYSKDGSRTLLRRSDLDRYLEEGSA